MSQLKRRKRGSALILVIGVLVLLSIIGTAFVTLMRIESVAARNYNDDIAVRFLVQEALAYCAQHPTWNPPRDASIIPVNDNHIDSDGDGENDCQFLTAPLNDRTRDTFARYAILKKPFAGRLNVNRNSGWIGPASDNHALNAGASTNEISLVEPVAAYLNYMRDTLGIATGNNVQNYHVAEEISRRICNMRFGAWGKPLGLPPYPAGTSTNSRPGEDTVDGDVWLDEPALPDAADPPVPPLVPPAANDEDDVAAWVGLNWRPNPAVNGVDDDGDGEIDELGEEVNEPDEFTENPLILTGSWWANDDEPFDTSDLLSIINNSPSDLRALINDATQTWAVAQGYAFDGTGATDYFDYLRVLFTTESRDYIGSMTPLNHLNILLPSAWTDAERKIVDADHALFIATLRSVFESGAGDSDEMDPEAASLAAWQVLANYIDFLDTDLDPGGSGDEWGLLNVIVKPEGWDVDTDDADGDGYPSAYTDGLGAWKVEDNCRLFFGTERQPYINEIYVYNRGNDRFDNDGDGVIDNDPLAVPVEPPPYEVDTDAYFVELHNHYASDIVLFNNPAIPATDETLNWALRIKDSVGTIKGTYDMAAAYKWDVGTSTWITGLPVRVPAGGYLIIASTDYSGNDNLNGPPRNNDNTTLGAAGLRLLPDPTALPAGTEMVNLNLALGVKMLEPDDTIELVYGYDPDGTNTTNGIVQAVVDRQDVPDAAHLNAETSAATGTRDFIPSFERHDPRVARIIRGTVDIGQPLTPTWDYTNAETAVPTSGGDQTRQTLGTVNDDGNANAVPADYFDGNYDLGAVAATRYDDLVDIPNNPNWKFANVGAMGSLLAVGPMPLDPTAFNWSDPTSVIVSDPDYWLIKCSPYTAVPDVVADHFSKRYPLDAKKIDFISPQVYAWDGTPLGTWYDISALPDNFPTGRAISLFDRFTTFAPRKDGKDNDGDWNASTDESDDLADNSMPPDGIDDPGPTPGDAHVDETDEVYVYGRIDINNSNEYILAGLPYVMFDDSTLDPLGQNIQRVYLTATTDLITGADGILQERNIDPFEDRADFLTRMVHPLLDLADASYNPLAVPAQGAFGRDVEDNHWYEDGVGVPRRTAWPYEWKTSQRIPRTFTNTAGKPYDFILPGEAGDGGDLLRDDKSEIDYTVGALMNMIAIETDLPAAFATGGADLGIYTYYITVQITDGKDVDGDNDGGDHANDATEPDWAEGTVLSEKRIVALVNTNLPLDDPGRITVFNWEFEGNAPAR